MQGERNIMQDFRLSDAKRLSGQPSPAEAFVGGLWQHLQDLLLYTQPSPASAARAQPNAFSGAYRHDPCATSNPGKSCLHAA